MDEMITRELLAEAELFIVGYVESGESGVARQRRARQWLNRYRDQLKPAVPRAVVPCPVVMHYGEIILRCSKEEDHVGPCVRHEHE